MYNKRYDYVVYEIEFRDMEVPSVEYLDRIKEEFGKVLKKLDCWNSGVTIEIVEKKES